MENELKMSYQVKEHNINEVSYILYLRRRDDEWVYFEEKETGELYRIKKDTLTELGLLMHTKEYYFDAYNNIQFWEREYVEIYGEINDNFEYLNDDMFKGLREVLSDKKASPNECIVNNLATWKCDFKHDVKIRKTKVLHDINLDKFDEVETLDEHTLICYTYEHIDLKDLAKWSFKEYDMLFPSSWIIKDGNKDYMNYYIASFKKVWVN